MNEAKKVLYFAENAISPIQGGGIVVYAVLKGLPKENVLGFYDYASITPALEYQDRMIRLSKWRTLRILQLYEHGRYKFFKFITPVTGFLLDLLFTMNAAVTLLFFGIFIRKDFRTVLRHVDEFEFKPDIVYFSGLSLRYLRLAVKASLYFDIPMCVLHMDNWMGKEKNMVSYAGWFWHQSIVKWMKRAAARSLSNTTNSPALAEVCTRLTRHEHKPANNCCPDLMENLSVSTSEKRDIPIVTYAGALNLTTQGDTLVIFSHAIAELNAEGHRVHLHVYTPWEFAPIANSIQIPNAVYYRGQVSQKELAKIYLNSDFLLATTTFDEENLTFFRYSLSTKLSEYLCVGKPVISIGNRNWHLHEYVQRHGCGFSIYDKDPARIKKELIGILATPPEKLESMGRKNRELWEKAHDVKVMARETRKVLGLSS